MRNCIRNTAIKHGMVYYTYPNFKIGTERLTEPYMADLIYDVGKL